MEGEKLRSPFSNNIMRCSSCKDMDIKTIIAIVVTAVVTALVGQLYQKKKNKDKDETADKEKD